MYNLWEELEYLRELKHKLLFAIIKGIGIIGVLYLIDFITN